MDNPESKAETARMELANRLFFRLYQCANMLHKTGTRAVEDLGLTTQQWAVFGALSRPVAAEGLSVGELARYLMVTRQNLAGVLGRMETAGHISSAPDGRDRRSRLVRLTDSGRALWTDEALPRILGYYGQALDGFSVNDATHSVHYLLKLLDNMKAIDAQGKRDGAAAEDADGA